MYQCDRQQWGWSITIIFCHLYFIIIILINPRLISFLISVTGKTDIFLTRFSDPCRMFLCDDNHWDPDKMNALYYFIFSHQEKSVNGIIHPDRLIVDMEKEFLSTDSMASNLFSTTFIVLFCTYIFSELGCF